MPVPGHFLNAVAADGCSTVARQSGPSRWDRADLPQCGPAFVSWATPFVRVPGPSHPADGATQRHTCWQAGGQSAVPTRGRNCRCRAGTSLAALTPGLAGPAALPAGFNRLSTVQLADSGKGQFRCGCAGRQGAVSVLYPRVIGWTGCGPVGGRSIRWAHRSVWTPAYDRDGRVRDAWVADVSGLLLDLSSWHAGDMGHRPEGALASGRAAAFSCYF